MTTPQMDWLDDQRRKRAVSSDDIVTRLRSENRMVLAPLHMSDAADELERLRAEVERLRAAIDALLTDIDGDHRPEWSSDEAEAAGNKPWCCAWCGAADGDWPCIHRRALNDLKEARRG